MLSNGATSLCSETNMMTNCPTSTSLVIDHDGSNDFAGKLDRKLVVTYLVVCVLAYVFLHVLYRPFHCDDPFEMSWIYNYFIHGEESTFALGTRPTPALVEQRCSARLEPLYTGLV